MATGRFPTETAAGDNEQRFPAGAPARPRREKSTRHVAPGRVAMGVANYDRIAVHPAASV